jgi:hypothetical protein
VCAGHPIFPIGLRLRFLKLHGEFSAADLRHARVAPAEAISNLERPAIRGGRWRYQLMLLRISPHNAYALKIRPCSSWRQCESGRGCGGPPRIFPDDPEIGLPHVRADGRRLAPTRVSLTCICPYVEIHESPSGRAVHSMISAEREYAKCDLDLALAFAKAAREGECAELSISAVLARRAPA